MKGRVRDRRANYLQSLAVLRAAKSCGVYTKSSIMLGLGERDEEVIDTLVDLKDCGVDIVTFGQYLQPTQRHLPVHEFVTPEKFEYWRRYGEKELGFRCRSTCHAQECAWLANQNREAASKPSDFHQVVVGIEILRSSRAKRVLDLFNCCITWLKPGCLETGWLAPGWLKPLQ
jgi:hypothetical protein